MWVSVLPLSAGTRIQMQSNDIAKNQTTQRAMLLDATRLRIDTDASQSMMFLTDGGRNRVVMLDRQRNEYREMDQETIDQLGQQLQGVMSQMEEQMKNLSPQQREMMEKMMKGRLPQKSTAPSVKTVYTKKGSGSVNGFSCTQYEGTRDGEKVSEVCAAQSNAVGLSADDFQVFEKMRDFMSGLQDAIANMPFAKSLTDADLSEPGFEGFPIQRISFSNGKPTKKDEMVSATKASFTDADFSVGNAKLLKNPAAGPRR